MSDQVEIGFSFASYWLRGWREFSRPITERNKAKPMQFWITFDTQLKIALRSTSYLKSEFILFFVTEGPNVAADILKVVLHKCDHSRKPQSVFLSLLAYCKMLIIPETNMNTP